jgi:hypothetical protein
MNPQTRTRQYLELVEQLLAHGLEDGLEEGAPEDEGGVVVGQRVAEGGHVAEAQPTRVVDLTMRHSLVA